MPLFCAYEAAPYHGHPDHPAGDFSFALSLVEHHKCKFVTATCYDSEEALHHKYPQARAILERFLACNQKAVLDDDDNDEDDDPDAEQSGTSTFTGTDPMPTTSPEWKSLSSPTTSPANNTHPHTPSPPTAATSPTTPLPSPHHTSSVNISFRPSISAQTLGSHKFIRRHAPYNKIVFNFPHVGGLSTDVNRQVRANQELLVAFFKSCKPLLCGRLNPVQAVDLEGGRNGMDADEEDGDGDGDQVGQKERPNGQVIISVFDGEPYSLWNIRDLARHSGFKVVTSWRFPWEAYPGYRHARTMGEVVRRKDGVERGEADGERCVAGCMREKGGRKKKGSWRGEEREARGFVFEIVDGDEERERDQARGRKDRVKKRRRETESSGSDD